MRTRFLNVDYFSHASKEAAEAVENLNFLRLPVPHIAPSNFCNEEEIFCFDSILSISLEITRLPIENALSRFFSDVLPNRIDVRNDDFPVIWSRNRNAFSDGSNNDEEQRNFESETNEIRFAENGSSRFDEELNDKPRKLRFDLLQTKIIDKEAELCREDKEVERQRTFRSGTMELELQKNEKESIGEEKHERSYKLIQFETPEMNFFLEKPAFIFEEEDRRILSEVPEIEIPLEKSTDLGLGSFLQDMLNNKQGVTIPYPYTVSESVYSVEDITSEYHRDQRISYFVEDAGSVEGKTCVYPNKYPLLEVNEIGLEFYTSPSMEEELHLLLEDIGYQEWTPNLMAGNELLGSTDIDILECLSEHCPSKKFLEPEPASLNLVLEMDFVSLKGTAHPKGNPVTYMETSDGASFSVMSPVHFQEVQILDLDFFQSFEVFAGSQTAIEPDTCDQMFREEVNSIGNFYGSIVGHELTIVDDSFKSLPIPVLSDDKELWSLSAIVEEILADLKPHPPSASDGIYLDWHLWQEDGCNSDTCSTYWNMIEEIDTYSTDSMLKFVNDGMVVIDFVFCDDTPEGSNNLEIKKILNVLHTDVAPSQLVKDDGQKPGIGKQIPEINAEKVSMLFESMSQCNDLDFFLNPRKATRRRNSEPAVKETNDTKAKLPVFPSSYSIAACASAEVKLQQWDIEVYQIKLSDNILGLIDKFQKSYLAILENDTDLKKKHRSFSIVDSFRLLSLPKQNLVDWIKSTSAQHTTLAHKDEILMAFVALYAIKQMAYYLCFFGIHTTHLYVDNISRSLEYLSLRLSFLQSLIEDAHQKANNEITESHPSLPVIQGILKSNTSLSGLKVLIVAEQVFWWPLKRLLTAMRKSFHGVQNIQTHPNQLDVWDSDEFTNYSLDSLLHKDCLLISHEHISASFPFNKFSIILEYGGSYGSSRISAITPNIVGLPRVHFLKVELEDFSLPKALCEGFDVPQNSKFTMEGISQSMSILHEDIKSQKLEELLNFVPIKENCIYMESLEPADNVEACSVPMSVSSMPSSMESKQTQLSKHSYPDTIVIVNTQNFDKEMLISQRSSYQKILAMEKGGVQVVEREINLPVDLIFSARMCLVWYDCRNIANKATATDEASSCIPLCVENIATNILTSLSFAFSDCMLVFEGESRFLAAIMESSDGLYAAAASLGVHLQLFCSYSSELTDEIVLNCIDHATKLNRGLYPKILESETLAESFLTRFPSINPLSAQAILSSGGMLVEFLEWSHDCRIQATGKYHVPEESVALFSALCRYGEQEETKSGMTECSSVSSAPDSGNSSSKIESQRKKQKCIMSPHARDIPMDDYILFEPLNQSTDANLKPSRVSQPFQSWIFSQNHEVLDGIEMSKLSPNDELFDRKQGLDTSVVNNLDWNGVNRSENVHEGFRGEVIDLSTSSLFGEDFSSIANTVNFPTRVPEKGKGPAFKNSASTRELSFDITNHAAFPTSSEINPDLDIWSSLKNLNQSLEHDIGGHADIDSNKDTLPLKTQGEFFEQKTMQRSTGNGHGLSFRENPTRPICGTPLSNAIHSSVLQRGSPWTFEFLNKIKEKSRMHQQSLLCNTAATCYEYFGDREKSAKRKSPSTLDCYRYQGGSNTKKIIKQKWQKRLIQPLISSKNEKASASRSSPLPTWTPIDKRARQTLSFARNGNERQSKLVWSDGNVHGLRKR